jgi:low affinity Fe/Cu permease
LHICSQTPQNCGCFASRFCYSPLTCFLIQNAQNRDGSAIQAKLDELIRAVDTARNDFIGIEHLTEAELQRIKSALEYECGDDETHRLAIDRLIQRR